MLSAFGRDKDTDQTEAKNNHWSRGALLAGSFQQLAVVPAHVPSRPQVYQISFEAAVLTHDFK